MKCPFFRIKEPFCGVSHGVGAGLSIAGLVLLLIVSQSRPWHTVSFALYGGSLIFLYTTSALYHSLHVSESTVCWLQRLDHSAIYVLIAGSYTPVCLVSLRGAWGWSLLGVIYGLAAVGITSTLLWKRAPDALRVTLCLGMGWLALTALGPLIRVFPPTALLWLVGGGLLYSVGTLIYAMDRPHLWPGKFSAHDLWHLFVLSGSGCHFVLMLLYVSHHS
jgi:hemolysin III